jgi:hypothetical protein
MYFKKHGRGAESGKIIAITTKGENSKGERSLCFPKMQKIRISDIQFYMLKSFSKSVFFQNFQK